MRQGIIAAAALVFAAAPAVAGGSVTCGIHSQYLVNLNLSYDGPTVQCSIAAPLSESGLALNAFTAAPIDGTDFWENGGSEVDLSISYATSFSGLDVRTEGGIYLLPAAQIAFASLKLSYPMRWSEGFTAGPTLKAEVNEVLDTRTFIAVEPGFTASLSLSESVILALNPRFRFLSDYGWERWGVVMPATVSLALDPETTLWLGYEHRWDFGESGMSEGDIRLGMTRKF